MALQTHKEVAQYGVTLTEGYAVVDDILIRKDHQFFDNETGVEFSLVLYTNKAARDAGLQPLDSKRLNVSFSALNNVTGDNIIAKLYEYVKTAHAALVPNSSNV